MSKQQAARGGAAAPGGGGGGGGGARQPPVRRCLYSSAHRGAYLEGCPRKAPGGCGGYRTFAIARALCTATADCGGITSEPAAGVNAYQLRRGGRPLAAAAAFDNGAQREVSWVRISCGLTLLGEDCPLVTLHGKAVDVIGAGAPYVDAGVSVFDAADGAIAGAPRVTQVDSTADAECAALLLTGTRRYGSKGAPLGGRFDMEVRAQRRRRAHRYFAATHWTTRCANRLAD